MKFDFIQTYTNKKFHFENPNPDEIDLVDIAHALAFQCRFAGHTKKYYSVAEHSCNVARISHDKDQLAGLLHDASEAYLTDIPSPIKDHLPDYVALEKIVQASIYRKFGLDPDVPHSVHQADAGCLVTEAQMLLTVDENHWTHQYEVPVKLDRCWVLNFTPQQAEKYFMLCYQRILEGKFAKNVNQLSTIHPPVAVRAA